LSEDPVTDYLITEAVVFKTLAEDKDAHAQAEAKAWQKDRGSLLERVKQEEENA
jgi:hypothetical protein